MMKRKILSVTLILALLLGGSAIFSASAVSRTEAAESGNFQVEEVSAEYLVKSHNNIVCVYQNGALVCSTGIRTASLPQSDRDLLEEGIPVQTTAELASLLEDLGS